MTVENPGGQAISPGFLDTTEGHDVESPDATKREPQRLRWIASLGVVYE